MAFWMFVMCLVGLVLVLMAAMTLLIVVQARRINQLEQQSEPQELAVRIGAESPMVDEDAPTNRRGDVERMDRLGFPEGIKWSPQPEPFAPVTADELAEALPVSMMDLPVVDAVAVRPVMRVDGETTASLHGSKEPMGDGDEVPSRTPEADGFVPPVSGDPADRQQTLSQPPDVMATQLMGVLPVWVEQVHAEALEAYDKREAEKRAVRFATQQEVVEDLSQGDLGKCPLGQERALQTAVNELFFPPMVAGPNAGQRIMRRLPLTANVPDAEPPAEDPAQMEAEIAAAIAVSDRDDSEVAGRNALTPPPSPR